MKEFFEVDGKARISERAFENMPPVNYPEMYAARGQIVTLVDFIEPNSDPGVWEVVTADGVTLYPLPSELECVDPADEKRRQVELLREWAAMALTVLQHGIELMPPDQLRQWEGVRSVIESAPVDN